MFDCEECGIEFLAETERDSHQQGHRVKTIQLLPHVALISLPDGCTPGRHEAAVYFAEAVAELANRFPERRYQFASFDHEESERFGGVNSWLAIRL